MRTLYLPVLAALMLVASRAADLSAQLPVTAAPSGAPCFLLALGPAIGNAPSRVAIPAVLQLGASSSVRGAVRATDSLSNGSEPLLSKWSAPTPDSVLVDWTPHPLGGSLALRMVRDGSHLRGRYALHGHQADDGRGVRRGAAWALRVSCTESRLWRGAPLAAAERQLAAWKSADAPDTALARAETRAAFGAALLRTPIHVLSLMNYRIAEFACLRGRPPVSLAELRSARVADMRDSTLDWLADRAWSDAWDRPVHYARRGSGYEVRSVGPDGQANTPDDLVGAYDTIPLKRYRRDGCR